MIPTQLQSLIVLLGGLGLFLSSVNRIGAHAIQLGGRRLRLSLARHTSNRALTPLAGTALGALVQSSSGISAVLFGFVTAGVVSIPSAMVMLLWANIGSTALVLAASIDLQILGLAVLALAGIWLHYDHPGTENRRSALEALFTLSLLLLSIGLMHTGADGLSGGSGLGAPSRMDGVAAGIKLWVMHVAGASEVLGLAFGAVCAILTLSAFGTAIPARAALQAGLLPFAAAEMVIAGAVLGSGLSALAMGLVSPRGSQRLLKIF